MNSEDKQNLIREIRQLAKKYGLTLKKLADAVNTIAYADLFSGREHRFEEGTLKLNEVHNGHT